MSYLSDGAVERLRRAAAEPDLSGTRYQLLEPLGRGGMGAVWRARDPELEREVAVKVLDAVHPEAARRMLQEARVVARLEHPGIVPVHDAGALPDGRVWYAMRLVRGARLDAVAAERRPLPELLRVFERICDAVAFAHAHGVIHRDLKPENVMVGPFGEVLVMDWGVAKVTGQEGPAAEGPGAGDPDPAGPRRPGTAHGTVLGTPGFMAPEQARGEVERVDERSDVYALGAILRGLLAAGGSASAPRPLAAVCRKALAADPAQRYPSAAALAAEVARHLDGLPVAAYREGALERLRRVGRRYRLAIYLVLAYLLMRGLLLVWTGF